MKNKIVIIIFFLIFIFFNNKKIFCHENLIFLNNSTYLFFDKNNLKLLKEENFICFGNELSCDICKKFNNFKFSHIYKKITIEEINNVVIFDLKSKEFICYVVKDNKFPIIRIYNKIENIPCELIYRRKLNYFSLDINKFFTQSIGFLPNYTLNEKWMLYKRIEIPFVLKLNIEEKKKIILDTNKLKYCRFTDITQKKTNEELHYFIKNYKKFRSHEKEVNNIIHFQMDKRWHVAWEERFYPKNKFSEKKIEFYDSYYFFNKHEEGKKLKYLRYSKTIYLGENFILLNKKSNISFLKLLKLEEHEYYKLKKDLKN